MSRGQMEETEGYVRRHCRGRVRALLGVLLLTIGCAHSSLEGDSFNDFAHDLYGRAGHRSVLFRCDRPQGCEMRVHSSCDVAAILQRHDNEIRACDSIRLDAIPPITLQVRVVMISRGAFFIETADRRVIVDQEVEGTERLIVRQGTLRGVESGSAVVALPSGQCEAVSLSGGVTPSDCYEVVP